MTRPGGSARTRPPVISIAGLGPPDAARLAGLHAAAFARPWPEQEFARMLTGRVVLGLAARVPDRGEMAGFVLARTVADEAEILTLAVAPDFRRLGFGGALLAAAVERAARRGCRGMFLEVDEQNEPAVALYKAYGFVAVGRRTGYYRGPDGAADALVLKRKIGSVVDGAAAGA